MGTLGTFLAIPPGPLTALTWRPDVRETATIPTLGTPPFRFIELLLCAKNWSTSLFFHSFLFLNQCFRAVSSDHPNSPLDALTIYAACIRALIYLRDTVDWKLTYAPIERDLEVFVDSSWLTTYSCSGAFFTYGGCVFHWFSKVQKSVSLSSAEAEYFGAMLAARDVVFFRDLLVDLDIRPRGPTVIYSDSKSAVDMSIDPVAFKQTKHIMRAAAFLRDLVQKEVTELRHLAGYRMIADILTKAQARHIFSELMKLLGYGTPDLVALNS